jgi:hypothetical protein
MFVFIPPQSTLSICIPYVSISIMSRRITLKWVEDRVSDSLLTRGIELIRPKASSSCKA